MDLSKMTTPSFTIDLAPAFTGAPEGDPQQPGRDLDRFETGSNVTPLLPLGVGLTASDLKAQLAFADGLPEQVAILDKNWTFLGANRAWARAAADRPRPGLAPGSNYLSYCEERARQGDEEARTLAEAMRRIDAGQIGQFEYFEGSGGLRGPSHQVRLYACTMPRRQWRVIARYDVTEIAALKRQTDAFADRLLHAEAEERRRVARDLHDTTAQDLFVLQLTLANLKRGRGALFREKLTDADEALHRLQQEIKSISFLFHSPVPDQPSLSKGLETLAKGFGQRTGIHVTLWLDEADVLDSRLCMMVHRLTQEALANVHRHSAATEVEIRLFITEQRLHLMIKDDGVGFKSGFDMRDSVGVGLRSMVERVEELGGRLVLKTGDNGTSIIASLPFHEAGSFASLGG